MALPGSLSLGPALPHRTPSQGILKTREQPTGIMSALLLSSVPALPESCPQIRHTSVALLWFMFTEHEAVFDPNRHPALHGGNWA